MKATIIYRLDEHRMPFVDLRRILIGLCFCNCKQFVRVWLLGFISVIAIGFGMEWIDDSATDNEYRKLIIRMNPPRVAIDNMSCENATLVKVDSANRHGVLLEVVQALTDLNLSFRKAYISSDGAWFMDVFHVTNQDGNKLTDERVIEQIQQSLGANSCILPSLTKAFQEQDAVENTAIELTGTDRPGILSEILAVLTDLNCNVVEAEIWTHNMRVACVLYVTDGVTGAPIGDPGRLSKVKELLCNVLKRDDDIRGAKTAVSMGLTHTERRLHQLMFADRDYERADRGRRETLTHKGRPLVTVQNCDEKRYSVVNVWCKDRPKLLFDTVCTLTDMQYVVFHATVNAQGPEAYQEYYIRHTDGRPLNSEAEKQRVIQCLEAAIERRASEGLRLELCPSNQVGLLSDVTRIFRENGLSVIRAEIATRGEKGVHVFYVTDASGNLVDAKTVEAIRREIGKTVLQVKEGSLDVKSSSHDSDGRFSFGGLLKYKSERLLYSIGFAKSLC